MTFGEVPAGVKLSPTRVEFPLTASPQGAGGTGRGELLSHVHTDRQPKASFAVHSLQRNGAWLILTQGLLFSIACEEREHSLFKTYFLWGTWLL